MKILPNKFAKQRILPNKYLKFLKRKYDSIGYIRCDQTDSPCFKRCHYLMEGGGGLPEAHATELRKIFTAHTPISEMNDESFYRYRLLSTSSNHSEEPECFNFLFDTLSLGAALILNFLDTNKHFTRNISVGRKKYQRRVMCGPRPNHADFHQ